MLRKAPDERFLTMEEAVIAAGARPLMHDDPSRDQLIALAKTGLMHRIVSQAVTPRSPVPRPTRASLPTRVARNPLLLAGSSTALVAAGFLLAKMFTGSPAPVVSPDVTVPAPAAADSTSVAPPPTVSKSESSTLTPPAPRQERRTQQPPQRPAPVTTAPAVASGDSVRPAPTRADSSGIPAVQKAETTVRVPPIAPPPVSAGESPLTRQPASSMNTPVRSAADDVTAVIQSYARALGAGDLAAARRIYQTMPNDQRLGLENLWAAGGTITPTWTISDIVITGDVATAQVSGVNIFAARGQTPERIPVSLRARLERRNNAWRLVALVN